MLSARHPLRRSDHSLNVALRDQRYVGFPPSRSFLMLPASPSAALAAGLTLYDGVEPHQRALVTLANRAFRWRLGRLLTRSVDPRVDFGWWEGFIAEVATPILGRLAHVAFRVPPNGRTCALLLAADASPAGFVKLPSDTHGPAVEVSNLLARNPARYFRTPGLLDAGECAGRGYELYEPLPTGLHRPPPFEPDRVHAVVDELHGLLAQLPRPGGEPPAFVPCHSDFTPRNLRVTPEGAWWLLDFDTVRWGPRMADELRYWAAHYAYQRRPHPARDAQRILGLLRARATTAEVLEAVRWTDRVQKTYRPTEQRLAAEVARLCE